MDQVRAGDRDRVALSHACLPTCRARRGGQRDSFYVLHQGTPGPADGSGRMVRVCQDRDIFTNSLAIFWLLLKGCSQTNRARSPLWQEHH